MIEINKIYNEDCIDTLHKIPNEFIDCVITSPPYDNLRNYNGYNFDFENIANELYRTLKIGGVIIWIVGDQIINGSESLTSFKQALYFKEIGLNVHDTMIYQKTGLVFPERNRYNQCFEYMFVLSKGKPKTFNPIKEKTITERKKNKYSTYRNKDGSLIKNKYEVGKEEKNLSNIWKTGTGFCISSKDKIAFKHPAIFPEIISDRHIITWTNENDLVYDCFGGSGTTAKSCIKYNRNYILSEISKEYVDICNKRLKPYINQIKLI